MAIKAPPPRLLLHNLRCFLRPLHSSSSSSSSSSFSSSVSPLNFAEKPEPAIENFPEKPESEPEPEPEPEPKPVKEPPPTSTKEPCVLDLNDHQKLFESVPTSRLARTSVNLHLAALEPMVDLGMWVMNSRLMNAGVLRGLVKHTFFKHFCGGENMVEAGESVRRLDEAGLRGMLVFAVEDATDNHSCDANLDGFFNTIQCSMSLPPSSVSCVVVKISAICPLNLLQRVSDLLRWQYKDPSLNLPWKENTLPIFSESSPLYHTLTKPEPLTPEEERDFQQSQQRLAKLCQKCVEAGIPLTIDAEHLSIQPAIDYMTYSSAIKYNRDANPIIYGTIQAYLKDAKERLFLTAKVAEKMGIPMGFKLVRGAYMSSETKIAAELGYDSPIHNTIQETHACYNECASFMLEKIVNGSDAVVLATHNVESGRLAAKKAHDLGIGKKNRKLEFAQLYGMAEALSYGLRNAGFQVSKYMPYGPVNMAMPYLLRRAEENRGMLSASGFDRELLRKELKRRLIKVKRS